MLQMGINADWLYVPKIQSHDGRESPALGTSELGRNYLRGGGWGTS